jgi:AcrR family transcriptional regulator
MANTSSTPKQIGREEVIRRLVAAAATLFAEDGPDGVSLRQIAAKAGVNYGLIHQYVGTKDDLLRLVFRSVSESAAGRFAEAGDLDAALDAFAGADPQPSQYVRMLAWALLQGRDAEGLLGRSPALATLLARIDPAPDTSTEARMRLASAVAMGLGWQLFGPFIANGVGLGDAPAEDLRAHRKAILRSLVFTDATNQTL